MEICRQRNMHLDQDAEREWFFDRNFRLPQRRLNLPKWDPNHETEPGIGFKAEHFGDAVSCVASGLWFEVHAENYMVEGGPRLAMLEALRNSHPLSLHGVGLSLAADADPDMRHVARLKMLVDRFEPFVVSEHLAWSTWRGVHNPGLLPFPRTGAALDRIVANVMRVQDALGRAILVENPALYMPLDTHELTETEFLEQLVRRSGCGLLIDVNNVFVSADNLGFGAQAYLEAIPYAAIGELHLAGHAGRASRRKPSDRHP